MTCSEKLPWDDLLGTAWRSLLKIALNCLPRIPFLEQSRAGLAARVRRQVDDRYALPQRRGQQLKGYMVVLFPSPRPSQAYPTRTPGKMSGWPSGQAGASAQIVRRAVGQLRTMACCAAWQHASAVALGLRPKPVALARASSGNEASARVDPKWELSNKHPWLSEQPGRRRGAP